MNIAKLPKPDSRFPPPWSVEELDECFVVKDGAEQKALRLSVATMS